MVSCKGKDVTIASIDTGISDDQELLNDLFATGSSSGRTITVKSEIIGESSTHDNCGHGTTMAGQIAGPLNNEEGLVGAAYKVNIEAYKVANDVLLNLAKERHAFLRAVESVVENGEASIIAVAMGRFTQSSILKDAADLAHDNGILMICAAGSLSLAGGIYPAKYDNTIAVTSVRYRPEEDPDGLDLKNYLTSVKGDFVDFAVYMKRDAQKDQEEYGAGMRMQDDDLRVARGSSAGVAIIAGVAAQIKSTHTTLNKQQIIDRLIDASSFKIHNNKRDEDFGWGIVDAELAVSAGASTICADEQHGPPFPG